MREITIEEHKEIQLDILKEIDCFCSNNSINYFLAFGTLIGAIRHKGFIPWDDDIDIAMPRPDYNRFISTFNGYHANLKVLAPELDPNYYAPYANVIDNRTLLIEKGNKHRGVELGVKIDVFPIDGVPKEMSEYNKYVEEMSRLNHILYIKRHKPHSKENVRVFLGYLKRTIQYMFFSYSSIQKQIIRLANSYLYDTSVYVDHCTFSAYHGKRFEREALKSFIDVKFEDFHFKAPIGYDHYLRSIYGDYMQLPPENKRIPHHHFRAYWKD